MASTDDSHEIASRPSTTEEPQQTCSPEPIEPVLEMEEMLVARLTQGLENCDWDQLQEKYTDAMGEHRRVEDDLRAQTTKLLDVFTTWSQTAKLQDEQRALKRFKTQMQHVQNSEASVENKKKHCKFGRPIFLPVQVLITRSPIQDTEVVKAFQNALALLNEQLKA
ncbi:hypothetical protein N7507_004498 [Penicillium longicatenatum]|nr:hypothetical protein N7507_004498 [Penicillium longicatenatum]